MKRIIAKLSIIMLIITAVFGAGSRVSAERRKTELNEVPTTENEGIYMQSDNEGGQGRSIRWLNLRVMLGNTYYSSFANAYSNATSKVAYVDIPFKANWAIGFTPSYTNIAPLYFDDCQLSVTAPCTNSSCGSNCNNAITNNIHHKNGIKNLNHIRTYISDTGYDLMLTLVASPMCGIWGNAHSTNIKGVTYNNDNYTLVQNKSGMSTNEQVRIMQHEISHMFGCHDGMCTSGADCLMNGQQDGTSLYKTDIWCSACYATFNPNAH